SACWAITPPTSYSDAGRCFGDESFPVRAYPVLAQVSLGCSEPKGTFPRVTLPSAAPYCYGARLACVRPAASVRSEPGSNSQVGENFSRLITTFDEVPLIICMIKC